MSLPTNHLSLPEDTVLLLVDIQKGFDEHAYWGPRNNPDAEANAARLLAAWRTLGRPVIHVYHNSVNPRSPLRPGLPGNEIRDEVRPLSGEPVLSKNVHSAFIGTDLEARLRSGGHGAVVVAGLTTPHCVSTTARMASDLGFAVTLVSDATAAHDAPGPDGRVFPAQVMHDTTLASLHDEFATIARTEQVLAALGAPEPAAAR